MNARNRFLNIMVASLFLMSATGCICVVGGGGGGASKGNVTMLWTFGGHGCAYQAGWVSKVQVTIPGQTLENHGVYACNTAGSDGIKLLNFKPGTYNFTIQGLTDNNVVLYEGSGNFVVNGDVTVNVDLAAASGAPAYAYVTWTFPANSLSTAPNCTQTAMQDVVITVDNGAPQAVTCASGFGTTGVLITSTAGTHTIDVAARDNTGMYYYRKTSTLPALVAGAAVSAEYRLDWFVGSLPMKWQINTAIVSTCALEGIANVRIDLVDSQNQYTFGTAGVTFPCSNGGVQGAFFQYLNPDTYKIYVQALGTGNWQYRSNFTTPPTFQVVAGQFPVVDNTTPEITVTKCATATCQ